MGNRSENGAFRCSACLRRHTGLKTGASFRCWAVSKMRDGFGAWEGDPLVHKAEQEVVANVMLWGVGPHNVHEP